MNPSSIAFSQPTTSPSFSGAFRVKEVVINTSKLVDKRMQAGKKIFTEGNPEYKQLVPDEDLTTTNMISAIDTFYENELNLNSQDKQQVMTGFHMPHMDKEKRKKIKGPSIVVAYDEPADKNTDGSKLAEFEDAFVDAKETLLTNAINTLKSIAPKKCTKKDIQFTFEESTHDALLDMINPDTLINVDNSKMISNPLHYSFDAYKKKATQFFNFLTDLRKNTNEDLRKIYVNINSKGEMTVDREEKLEPEQKKRKLFFF